jgi:hypothetical protein
LRLDPHSLPVSFDAHDGRADGGVRRIELHREQVILRRAVRGMRMAINVRVSDFLGIAVHDTGGASLLMLVHRDPSLSVPLCEIGDPDTVGDTWRMWSDALALPQLSDEAHAPAPRRRRHNAIRGRRPRFLVRRRGGGALDGAAVHRDEREIIARD